eukprot:scaffold146505_cov15-Tisochrysis_lutea.AAC.1
MQFLQGLRNIVLPVARAEQLQEEINDAPPAPTMPFEAPEPAVPRNKSLESLSPEEIESLKQEIVNEVVTKIAGEENEKLEDFLEPEVRDAKGHKWCREHRVGKEGRSELGGCRHQFRCWHVCWPSPHSPPPLPLTRPVLCGHAACDSTVRPALPQPQPSPALLCALQRVLQ